MLSILRRSFSSRLPTEYMKFFKNMKPYNEYVCQALNKGMLHRYMDPALESESTKFEKSLAKYIGTKQSLIMNSATSALLLACKALDIPEGENILVTSFTWISVFMTTKVLNYNPILINITKNQQMDVNDLEKKIKNNKVRYLILSQFKSSVPNLDEIVDVCKRYSVTIIEDSAQVLGFKYKNKMVGSFGKVGLFSFQSNKLLDIGEGGAITTNDPDIIVKSAILSGIHETSAPFHDYQQELKPLFDKYDNKLCSYNFRMNELQAALLNASFPDLEGILSHIKSMHVVVSKNLDKNKFYVPSTPEGLDSTRINFIFKIIGLSHIQIRKFQSILQKQGFDLSILCDDKNIRLFTNIPVLKDNLDQADLQATYDILIESAQFRLSEHMNTEDAEDCGRRFNEAYVEAKKY